MKRTLLTLLALYVSYLAYELHKEEKAAAKALMIELQESRNSYIRVTDSINNFKAVSYEDRDGYAPSEKDKKELQYEIDMQDLFDDDQESIYYKEK